MGQSRSSLSADAAQLLNLSVRQLHRLPKGLPTAGRGWPRPRQPDPPAHNAADAHRARRELQLATTKHASFNQQHLTEESGRGGGDHAHAPPCTESEGSGRRRSSASATARHRRRRNRYPRKGMLTPARRQPARSAGRPLPAD